jgi:hypothetical protein
VKRLTYVPRPPLSQLIGAVPFLRKMPAAELHNLRVSLDAFWGAGSRDPV